MGAGVIGQLKALYGPKKDLPPVVTTYDVLKTLAIVLMIIDHIGAYFYPDENWFRVVGRMCVPMWFFLIGYARSRDLSLPLWIGAAALIIGDMVVGRNIFPLSILPTMLITRLLLDHVMALSLRNIVLYWTMAIGFMVLAVPTTLIYEYGLMSFVLAGFGYIVRHRDEIVIPKIENHALAACVLTFTLFSAATFGFDQNQILALIPGIIVVFYGLLRFRPDTYPDIGLRIPAPLPDVIRFVGRHTLLIYVVHLLAFKLAALLLGYEHFGWFDFAVFEDSGKQLRELYDALTGKGFPEQ